MAGKPKFNYSDPNFIAKMWEIYPQRGGSKILRDMFGVCESTVCAQARRLGIVSDQQTRLKLYYESKSNGHFEKMLREWVPQEGGVTYLSKIFGVNTEIIRIEAGKIGLCSPDAQLKRFHRESLKVNFFNEWNAVVAYYLGYVWADGWIECHSENRSPVGLGLKCKRDDEEIILSLRDRLGSQHAIGRGVSRNSDGSEIINRDGRFREFTTVVICSKELADSLVFRHGIFPGKSQLNLPFPTNIPPEFLRHFARGHFDGDGSCGVYSYEYTKSPKTLLYYLGSELFIYGLKAQILSQLDLANVTPQKNKNIFYLQWQSISDIEKIYHWMYPTSDVVCLPRKRDYLEKMIAGEPVPETGGESMDDEDFSPEELTLV